MRRELIIMAIAVFTVYSSHAQTAEPPDAWSDGTGGSILNINQLYWLSQHSEAWDEDWVLSSDIDASGSENWDAGAGWNPLGNGEVKFTGTFDGAGRTISNLTANRPGADYLGFFGKAMNAEISNLTLANCSITGRNYLGILLGIAMENVSISNCNSSGSISGTGQSVGGLVGQLIGGSVIEKSSSVADVMTTSYGAGGLLGYIRDSAVLDCFARGRVEALCNVGGLIGQIYSNNDANYEINRCYSTGEIVYSYDVGVEPSGGLIGKNTGSESVNNSYWDTQTSGMNISEGGEGKTSSAMKNADTYSTWDFAGNSGDGTDEIWHIDPEGAINDGYPGFWEFGITSFSPVDGAGSVSVSPSISIDFDKDIDIVPGKETGIVLKNSETGSVAATASSEILSIGTGENTNRLIIDFSGQTLAGLTLYTLEIAGDVIESGAHGILFDGLPAGEYIFETELVYSEIDISYDEELVASGSDLNLGRIETIGKYEYIFTISNSGINENLVIDSESPIDISGNDADKFTVKQLPLLSVAPGEVTSFIIEYLPDRKKVDQAVITVNNSETPGEDEINETRYGINIAVESAFESTGFSEKDSDGDGTPDISLSAAPQINDTKSCVEIGFQIASDYDMTQNMIYIVDENAVEQGYILLDWDEYTLGSHYYCRSYILYDDGSYDFGEISSFEKNEGNGVIRIGG